jgi:hypothetical protein
MKYHVDAFFIDNEIYPIANQLSEEGKKSISWQILMNYYTIANRNLNSIRDALRAYRQPNNQICNLNPPELKPSSYRLEFELLALIATNLNQMPGLENIIKADQQTTEARVSARKRS